MRERGRGRERGKGREGGGGIWGFPYIGSGIGG